MGSFYHRTRMRVLALAVLSGCLICSNATIAAETGMVETPKGKYVFTPSSCGIHQENGIYDIEVEGPGTAPDGEVIFVEFSTTAQSIVIKLGVDRLRASSDRVIRAGAYVTQGFEIAVSDKSIIANDLVFMAEDGVPMTGTGRLEISCN